MKARRVLKRLGAGCLSVILLLAILIAATPAGKDIQNFWKVGAIQAYLFPAPKKAYTGDNEAHLKALYTALMLYHDSEDKFPEANGWMDAIEPRLWTNDLGRNEGKKKLIRPDLAGKPESYGYAINRAAAGKYKDDVGPADTILIFESKSTARNASGDPSVDREGMAITTSGQIKK